MALQYLYPLPLAVWCTTYVRHIHSQLSVNSCVTDSVNTDSRADTLNAVNARVPLLSVVCCCCWCWCNVSVLMSSADCMSLISRCLWALITDCNVDCRLPRCRNTCSAVATWLWFYHTSFITIIIIIYKILKMKGCMWGIKWQNCYRGTLQKSRHTMLLDDYRQ